MHQRRVHSAIWNHFKDIGESDFKKAICNTCNNILSYKSTITNLKLHLKQKHIEVYEEYEETRNAKRESDKLELTNDDETEYSHAEEELRDQDQKHSESSTERPTSRESVSIIKGESNTGRSKSREPHKRSESTCNESHYNEVPKKRRRKHQKLRYVIWNYFEDIGDGDIKKAICNICKNILSYKTTITNLKTHLRQKHIEMYKAYRATEDAKKEADKLGLANDEEPAYYLVEEEVADQDHSESSNERPPSPELVSKIKGEPRTVRSKPYKPRNRSESPCSESDSFEVPKWQRKTLEIPVANEQIINETLVIDTSNGNEDVVRQCHLYSQLLAAKLKTLDVDDRLTLMNEIDNLVFKYLMKIRKGKNLPTTSTDPLRSNWYSQPEHSETQEYIIIPQPPVSTTSSSLKIPYQNPE